MFDERPQAQELLRNIKRDLAALEALLNVTSDHWAYEDPIYRFWHQSMKVPPAVLPSGWAALLYLYGLR